MACQLAVEAVGYRYGTGQDAVAGIDFAMGAGVLGLLGPNGAGKSTLMRVLSTLTKATTGRVSWNGADIARRPDALRRELGYLPQDFGVYPSLTAREFLQYLAAVKGLRSREVGERVADCLAKVGLADAADRRLGDFSGGMRQRVGIAQALLNQPRLLIVDEPTLGLDPEERMRFRHLISDLAADRLVILSTHIVSDIEASATALAVMSKGRLLYFGPSATLLLQARGHVWERTVAESEVAEARAGLVISSSLRVDGGVQLRIVAADAPSSDASVCLPGLDEAYLWLLARDGAR